MKPEKPVEGNPWVWYAPTLKNLPNGMLKFYAEHWLHRGIAVAGCDLGEVGGAPKSSQQFTDFYDVMVGKGYSKKPVLLGQSRGGLMMFCWAFRNPGKLKAIAGIYPVCNLADWPMRAMKQATLDDYEMSEDAFLKQLGAFNPPNNLTALAKNQVPIFIVHGDSDKIVPYDHNGKLIKEAYEKAGGEIEVKVVPDQGHNGAPQFFKDQDLLEFVSAQCTEKPLFNGRDLSGWRGAPGLWSVVDGAIMGQTTAQGQIKGNAFLIYEKPFADFELNLKYKILSGNSGIQYRATVADEQRFRVTGYQADIDSGVAVSGIFYEEGGRGILAMRGQNVAIATDGEKQVAQFGNAGEIQKNIDVNGWNDYRIVANGNRLQHFINGHLTADVTDQQSGKRADSGVIALQLHAGPAMQVFFKDITIKAPRTSSSTPPTMAAPVAKQAPQRPALDSKLPDWIWHRNAHDVESAVLRKLFKANLGQTVVVRGTCDNEMKIMLNGKEVGASTQWERPVSINVSAHLVAGENELRVIAKDQGGIAALALSVTVDDKVHVSDSSWQSATPEEAANNKWSKPITIGTVGDAALPWKSISAKSFNLTPPAVRQSGEIQTAVAAPELNVPKGFKAELVYAVPKSTQGSWVALTTDDKGRLYTSDQGKKGMYRITPAVLGDPKSR